MPGGALLFFGIIMVLYAWTWKLNELDVNGKCPQIYKMYFVSKLKQGMIYEGYWI